MSEHFGPLEPDKIVSADDDEVDLIEIHTTDGELIFAIRPDGSVYLPDPARVEEAAATFWRAVQELAENLGWTVRRSL